MTIADQLRSFPVPPRHVLIEAAGEIERLRRENERLRAERERLRVGGFRDDCAFVECGQHKGDRDALRSENNQLLEGFIPAN